MSRPFGKTKEAHRNRTSKTQEDDAEQKFNAMHLHHQEEEKEKEEASVDTGPSNKSVKNVPPQKKVTAAVRNWTCQAKDADAEQKFHAKVEKNLFRRRHSLTNENLKLSDGWLMMDASNRNLRSVNSMDKLAVKSTAAIDNTDFFDSNHCICISNLPETMTTASLEPVLQKFGPIQKISFKRNPNTGLCKGFAYVTFNYRKDAAKAIQLLNGHKHNHLILKVEWSKT